MCRTLTKCDLLKGRLSNYFFLKICSSGGKQTIRKVSAASMVKRLPSSNIRKCQNLQELHVVKISMAPKWVRDTFRIVCSQTSCAVLFHCFTDCTCARESTFFVQKLVARATNYRTIVLITNSINMCIIYGGHQNAHDV